MLPEERKRPELDLCGLPITMYTTMNIPSDAPRTVKPYPPSFVNRIMDAVMRLPLPYWLTYLLLFIVHSLIFMIIGWLDGWIPRFSINPLGFLFPLWLWGPLAFMTYLDSTAKEELSNFSPLLELDESGIQQLKYEFTTMPARSVLINSIFWTGLYILLTYLAYDAFFVRFELGTLLIAAITITGLLTFFIGSPIYYHIIRQLRLVHRTVKAAKPFNLFQLDPVYAFSRLTAQTGIAVIILFSLTLLIFPLELVTAPVLLIYLAQVGLAAAAFVLPLWIVNRRLVVEKRRLLAEHNQRVEAALSRLHRALDNNELEEVEKLNEGLSALNSEREVLGKIPTLPWRTATLTSFLSALVLPIVLFIIQLVIGKWLGN